MSHVKPIELKIAQGTARKDRIPKNPIRSNKVLKVPKCPAIIESKIGKIKWKQICQIMIAENRLTEPDLFLVESLVSAYEIWYLASEKLNEAIRNQNLIITRTNKHGEEYEAVTKWDALKRQYNEIKDKLLNDLGFSPRVKGVINSTGSGNGGNPLKDYLAGLN